MSEQTETSSISLTAPAEDASLSAFLSYLVFEGHAIRVGLEMTLCVLLFITLDQFFPWSSFGITTRWQPITAWFSSCTLVVIFDQFFLCRPAAIFRHSYQLSLVGAYEKALQILEKISPVTTSIVKLPASQYHLLRADILTQSESFRAASCELELAALNGAKPEQVYILRSRLLRVEGTADAFSRAQHELKTAQSSFGETPSLALEEGLLLFEQRDNWWEAKNTLSKVSKLSPQPHFSGDSVPQLAQAAWEASRLWTGEAEEGLVGLSDAIERLKALAFYIDPLRPFLAMLYLERSHYYATHKEPEAAYLDLKSGLALCAYPQIRRRAKVVQEELLWRFQKMFSS